MQWEVIRLWRKWLNRRSQRQGMRWERFARLLEQYPLPRAKIMRPATVWAKGVDLKTPYVELPGLVSAECVRDGGFDYLAVSVHPDPADPRTDTIPGDLLVMGAPLKDWGLHLVDVNLAMGDLVSVVGEQAKAYGAGR